MQSQCGEGPSLEARHGREKVQGAERGHMLYRSNDCYSGATGRSVRTNFIAPTTRTVSRTVRDSTTIAGTRTQPFLLFIFCCHAANARAVRDDLFKLRLHNIYLILQSFCPTHSLRRAI
jgi:hypothetical protein